MPQTLMVLAALVGGILVLDRLPFARPVLKWLPTPLWCYLVPMAAVSFGWLPKEDPVYRLITGQLLPATLALLLFAVDIPSVLRTGSRALLPTAAGAAGVVLGTALMTALLHDNLPPEAWKGAGSLAATWTGGSMNLVAMRSLVDTPESMFGALVLVDAMIAYGWMALLVIAAGHRAMIDRWLSAGSLTATPAIESPVAAKSAAPRPLAQILAAALAVALMLICKQAAARMPISPLVSSANGWTILLVTTAALLLSLASFVRRSGAAAAPIGSVLLYLVLAAIGAQGSTAALREAPLWLAVGAGVLVIHAACLLTAGKLLRLPMGLLATASQANVGGFVSAPLVGAVYHRTLAPVGLLLAIGCNALGTYAGLLAAWLCRTLTGG